MKEILLNSVIYVLTCQQVYYILQYIYYAVSESGQYLSLGRAFLLSNLLGLQLSSDAFNRYMIDIQIQQVYSFPSLYYNKAHLLNFHLASCL